MSSNTLGQIPIFSPTQLNGCVLWLDGVDPNGNGSVPANEVRISTWVDKSGRNNNGTLATGTTSYNMSTRSIFFNGSAYYSLPNNTFPTGNGAYSIFIVSSSPIANFYSILGQGTANAGQGISIYYYPSGAIENGWWTTNIVTSTGVIIANQTSIIESIYNLTSLATFINGTSRATSSSLGLRNGPAGPTFIGARMDSSVGNVIQGLVGNINEFIVYSSGLSVEERQQVEGYLAWKWGLQSSLFSDHPYRNSQLLPINTIPNSIQQSFRGLLTNTLGANGQSFFNPTSIAGCQIWLDASDRLSMTFSSGSNLQTWLNKATSSSVFTRGGVADRVIYTSSNGYPLINFNSDGSTSNAWLTGSVSLTSNTSFLQVITPISYNVGTWSFYWSWQWNNPGDRVPGLRSSNVNNDLQPYITWVGNDNNRIPITNGTSYLSFVEFTGGGANTRYSINGNTPTGGTIAASNINSSVFILGGDGNSGATVWGKHYISEMIMYSNVLTTEQRQQAEGYLAWKWGLQANLPVSHPFRRLRPGLPAPIPVLPQAIQLNASAFSPLSVSGCSVWLDAADGSTISLSGTAVTQWRDKSGNGKNATTNSSVGPNYTQNVLNASPSLYFDGTNFMSFANNTLIGPNGTFFVVAKEDAGQSGQCFLMQNYLAFGVAEFQFDTTGVNLFYPPWQPTGSWASRISSWSLLGAEIIKITGRLNTYTNGSLSTSASISVSSTTGDTADGTNIGRYTVNGTESLVLRYKGFIAEIIYYNNVIPTTFQRQQVEGYLAWKWGLVGNLPATHPYKKWPPPP
jgi:hypothetical protein